MAAQRYRRVRRPAESPALTAASVPIDPDAQNRRLRNPLSSSARSAWQVEAWELMDLVGELRYYVSWRSNSCSKVRLVASELDEEGKPTGHSDNARVRQIVQSIGGNQLGAAQLIKRSVECLTVPGEVVQGIIVGDDGREQWLAFSKEEIRKTGVGIKVEMPDGTDHTFVRGRDALWGCWQPHPRRAKEPDSPVRASLSALREIVTTTKTIADAAKSRLMGNGIVFVPTEMSLPSTTAPTEDGDDPTSISISGASAITQLEELLYQTAKVSYSDDESFARMIPIFAAVSGESIKNVNHLKFDSELTDGAIKTRNDAIARLALSLDVSPERLLGLGSSTNHWSAWQIGDNDVQMHIAPVMELICHALTENVLRPMLAKSGVRNPERYIIWYDASELTADPDKSDDATDAFDRGVITANAYREFLNLGDVGYDLINGGLEAWQQWAADQIANDPTLITNLGVLVPALSSIEFPETKQIEAQTEAAKRANTTNEGNSPDTESEDPGYDQGKRGRKEDVGKRIVSHHDAFLQVFVTRALGLAGNRRRNVNDRTQKDRLRGIRPHEFHRLMPPVPESDIAGLISGWDDALTDEVLHILGADRKHFADQVRAEVRRQLTADATV